MHCEVPGAAAKRPAAHAWHTALLPPGDELPIAHAVQFLIAPAAQPLPAAQPHARQLMVPVAAANSPAGHAWHCVALVDGWKRPLAHELHVV